MVVICVMWECRLDSAGPEQGGKSSCEYGDDHCGFCIKTERVSAYEILISTMELGGVLRVDFDSQRI
jgi:hypothetical protein